MSSLENLFNPQTFSDFCDFIAAGHTLTRACELFDIASSRVYKFLRSYATQEMRAEYEMACQQRAAAYVDQAMDIADGKDVAGLGSDGQVSIDSEALASISSPMARKARIAMRQWAAERGDSRRFGAVAKIESRQVDGDGNDAIPVDMELLRKYAPGLIRTVDLPSAHPPTPAIRRDTGSAPGFDSGG